MSSTHLANRSLCMNWNGWRFHISHWFLSLPVSPPLPLPLFSLPPASSLHAPPSNSFRPYAGSIAWGIRAGHSIGVQRPRSSQRRLSNSILMAITVAPFLCAASSFRGRLISLLVNHGRLASVPCPPKARRFSDPTLHNEMTLCAR